MTASRDRELFTNQNDSTSDGSIAGLSESTVGNNTAYLATLNNVSAAHVVMQTRRVNTGSLKNQPWFNTGYTMGASVEAIVLFMAGHEYRALIKKAPSVGGDVSLSLQRIDLPGKPSENIEALKLFIKQSPGGFPNVPGALVDSETATNVGNSQYRGLSVMEDVNSNNYYLVGADLDPLTGQASPFHYVNATGAKIAGLPPGTARPATSFLNTYTWAEAQNAVDIAFVVDDPDDDLSELFDGLWVKYKSNYYLTRVYDGTLSSGSVDGGNGSDGGTGGDGGANDGNVPPPANNEADVKFSTTKTGLFEVSAVMQNGFIAPSYYEADGTLTGENNYFSKNYGTDASTKPLVLRVRKDGLADLILDYKDISAFDIDEGTGIRQLGLLGNNGLILIDAVVQKMPFLTQLKVGNTSSVLSSQSLRTKNWDLLFLSASGCTAGDEALDSTTALRVLYFGDSPCTFTLNKLSSYTTLEELSFGLKNLGLTSANLPSNWGGMKIFESPYNDTALTAENLGRMPLLEQLNISGSASNIGGDAIAKLPFLKQIQLSDVVRTQAAVDSVINQVASNANTNNITGGTLILQGSCPLRTASSQNSFNDLDAPVESGGLGWTVRVNS